jgi:hypothetical protein
MMGERSR